VQVEEAQLEPVVGTCDEQKLVCMHARECVRKGVGINGVQGGAEIGMQIQKEAVDILCL
jgi:hypothetical protein